jgi:hypothetical protein
MNYKDIHDKIIEKAKKENRSKGDGNYYEAHHIKPRCMDGEGKASEWKTHPNIVLLTAKEHFVIHKLLCEMYPDNNKLLQAYWLLANLSNKEDKNYRVGSREYERLKVKKSEIVSESNRGENNPNFGKNMSGENNPNFGHGEKMKGEKHPQAKKVICSITGKIYGCVKDAAVDIGISYSTLRSSLNGTRKNKTTLVLID